MMLNSSENMNVKSNFSNDNTSIYSVSDQQQPLVISDSVPSSTASQPPSLKDVKISRFTATSQLLIPTSGSHNNSSNESNRRYLSRLF